MHNKNHLMGNLFYVLAFFLMMIWSFSYIGFHAGSLVHLVLVLALVAVLLGLLQRRPL
jgi:hypothetical protein